MIFHDTLYGRFELPTFLEPLLMTPEFRRLSEVRLININSPALAALADVRRYSHTLGVLRLAMTNPLTNFGPDEHRALLASIIVHDAGTPAFAHLFEYQLIERYQWNHERVVPSLLTKRHHPDGENHQFHLSRRPEFEDICKRSGIDFELVLAILDHRHHGAQLVFGSVDFDNLDNVARMSWMLGQRFDVAAIIDLASALGSDGSGSLLLPESQRANLSLWASLRRQAYEVLVFDGPTVAGQAVLSELIAEAVTKGVLSVDDWVYTDHQLISVLQSTSAEAKGRLQRDFLGALPELRLMAQITDMDHPIFNLDKRIVNERIKEFLRRKKIPRPYGYCLRDRGTFEKQITAVDPTTGRGWSVGRRSNSLIIYGFGAGGKRVTKPEDWGREFVSWIENLAC